MRLTLLVPELLWPEPEDDLAWSNLACPALSRLLSSASLQRTPRTSPEAQAAAWLGLAPLPLGALRRLGEDQEAPASDQIWLCADPIHLRLHQEEIVVADSRQFDLELAEARELAESLNTHYAGEAAFHVAAPQRWYLRLTTDWAADLPWDALPPLSAVTGRRLSLPTPADLPSRRLLALMNEIQMLLHSHPVNERRAEQGQPPVNGLWLWGAGRLPQTQEPAAKQVWGEDSLARGLARLLGQPAHTALPTTASLLKENSQQTLVILQHLLAPAQDQDAPAWRQALARLEQEWFAPMLQALIQGQLEQLEIQAATSYGGLTWQLDRAAVTPPLLHRLLPFLAPSTPTLQDQARRLAAPDTP